MVDLPLGVLRDVFRAGMAIREAVKTVHQNEKDCQDLQVRVDTLINLLMRLQKTGLTSHPAMCLAALVSLHGSLERALKLVTKCQKRNNIHHFLTAGDMAKQLHRVQDDILMNMILWNLTITTSVMEVTVELTRTTFVQDGSAHPPPTLPQGAWGTELNSRHSTAGDAGIITTVTSGTEAPFAPSGWTEFSLSETVAKHHVSESISGRSGYTHVTMQKLVIKVKQMESDAHRSKAMSLISMVDGVVSMSIVGDGKDQVEVVGNGIDAVLLVSALRKKVAYAELAHVEPLQVGLVKQKDEGMRTKVLGAMDRNSAVEAQAQHKWGNRWTRTGRSGFRAITAIIPRFMRPRARSSRPRIEEYTDAQDEPAAAPPAGPSPHSHQLLTAATPPADDDDDGAQQLSHQFHHLPALEAPELGAATATTTGRHALSHLLNAAATPPADYSTSAQLWPLHLPVLEAPAMAEDDIFSATTDPPPLQLQPAAPPAATRRSTRRTFNVSKVHRSIRLPSSARHSRMMQPSSSETERSIATVLHQLLIVSCALCALLLLLLASVWALLR